MLELLAPAGSPDAVRAAVCAGADAVYLGYGRHNARRGARNFSNEEFGAAVSYCHIRGVKTYLTLNTLVTDRELPEAVEDALRASELGADGVLVQDLGLARSIRRSAPDLPIHASTQMTIHSLDGVRAAADMGMTRVVLGRELSKWDIERICQRAPIEIEVFVHGALCMSWSGQCFMSSVIGGRSGNRGMCAQPCRLMYGWGEKADSYPLSLKDMSLAKHLQELKDMGVASAKIEGRMKRPEYVYIVTRIYADALREGRDPTPMELRALEEAFSRQGFTDGYFVGEKGPEMFGVRESAPEPRKLFAEARRGYENGAERGVPVDFYALVRKGEPIQVGVEDPEGRVVTAQGKAAEAARRRAITKSEVDEQLSKTGGTPYRCQSVRSLVEDGLAAPVSAFNKLRREVLTQLTEQRAACPRRKHDPYMPGVRYENRRGAPVITVSLQKAAQLTFDLQKLRPALIYLPVEEIAEDPKTVQEAMGRGVSIAASLPRICLDHELKTLEKQLRQARELGIDQALVGNLGLAECARREGFALRGDYGVHVYNSQSEKELKHLGFQSVTASFELKLAQIRDLSKALDTEMIAYGRLPLMLTENCTIKNQSGKCLCANVNQLVDRKGFFFPVVKAWGCRNEILNANKLFLADKAADYLHLGLWAIRLRFTTENPLECVQVLERYLDKGPYTPNNFTRGLYYRDVE